MRKYHDVVLYYYKKDENSSFILDAEFNRILEIDIESKLVLKDHSPQPLWDKDNIDITNYIIVENSPRLWDFYKDPTIASRFYRYKILQERFPELVY